MLRSGLIGATALVVLLMGIVGMNVLIGLRQQPPRQVVNDPGPLVRVVSVQPQDVPITIEGFGTVRAKHVWSAVPEVSGTVVRLSPTLRAGLPIRNGEVLFEIDPHPYRLAVQRHRARVRQHEKDVAVLSQQRENHVGTLRLARSDLAIAEEDLRRDEELARRGAISTRERNRRRRMRNEVQRTVQNAEHLLALIHPQIEQAEAAAAAARADLETAEWRLGKTRLVAPFGGHVVAGMLDLGEFVSAGREAAVLYSEEAVEIPVAVPLDELRWLPMLAPEHAGFGVVSQPGTSPAGATVHWHGGGRDYAWHGEVVRWEAGADPETRTMTLVVEVRDPWASFQPGAHPALRPGVFCRVEVGAGTLSDVVVIPRTALYDGNTVYLAEDGRLARRRVEVARFRRDEVILGKGLKAGDKLVVSVMSAPEVGMQLRVIDVE